MSDHESESSGPGRGGERPRDLVELRIHGVSGTPPAGMLDARFAELRAGDATTGFYVPDPDEQLPAAGKGDRRRGLEGYSWRGMTSGSPLQALWVLLAPFALANTAAAMRPPVANTRFRAVARLHGALVRLFGLSLTLTLVMATFVVAIDQVAWQCGNNPVCVSGHTTTKVLGWGGLDSPPRRMALMLGLPLAMIALLWFLARRAWKARAAVLAVAGERDLAQVEKVARRTALDDPKQWEDREPSEFLRHVHVAAALSAVSAMTATGIAYWTVGSDARIRFAAGAAFGLWGVAALLATVGWGERRKRLRRFLSVGVLVASVAVFVALVAVLVSDPVTETPIGVALPGVETVIVLLFVSQLFVMFAVGLLGIVPWSANREHGVGLRGLGSGVVSGSALVLGAMFSAGVVLRAGDYLGQATTAIAAPATAGRVLIIVPNALTWAARGVVALVVLLLGALALGAVGAVLVVAVRSVPRIASAVRAFFHKVPAADPAVSEQRTREREVARAVRRATLTDRVGAILIGPALVALAVAIATSIIVVLIDTHHYDPAFEAHHAQWVADHSAAYGSWLITGFAVAIVLVVLRARSNESLRRKVGILWDLTTFWPRHAQPLGPPCYTDRALPELVFRISWHVERNDEDVIVSAHSQGSIIAAPVLLQLRTSVRGRVALLTYGSPLQRLYARWFPAFFDAATFEEMGQRLGGRWQNLFRTTDPIGGRIPPDPPPVNVRIEPVDTIPSGDYVYPAIRVHSDYPAEPEFRTAVATLDGQLRSSPDPCRAGSQVVDRGR